MNWARVLSPIDSRQLTTIFDISNRCNLRCRQCYFSYDSVFHRRPVFLAPDSFEHLAARLLPLSHAVVLSAATEPMASPHFMQILEITARYHPIEIKLLTNATLMTDSIAEDLVKHRCSEIHISVDGGSPAAFERIRRGARLDEFVRNVRRLVASKRRHRTREPRIQFNVTLMQSNLDELPKIVDLAADLGVQRIGCRHVVPYEGLGMESESLSLQPLAANLGMAEMRGRAYRRGISIVSLPDYFPIDGKPWRPSTARVSTPTEHAMLPSDPRFAAGPLGRIDSPSADPCASAGHLDLAGWALDPSGPLEVRVERDRFPEEAGNGSAEDRIVLGRAGFEIARRPDVAEAFDAVRGAENSGWHFHGSLHHPSWRIGSTMTIHAIAENAGGQRTSIGSRRVLRLREGASESEPPLYCSFPFSSVYVNPEGRLFPYPDCQGSDSYGTLDRGVRFEELWWGEVATELRQRIIDRDPPDMCQRCPTFINRRVSDPMLFEARDTESRYRLPVGWIETPREDVASGGESVKFRGWALGFAHVERVEIQWAAAATSSPGRTRAADFSLLGTAELLELPRGDLAARYRKYPHREHPDWRFIVQPHHLPGPGPHIIPVVAVNSDGGRSTLGNRKLESSVCRGASG